MCFKTQPHMREATNPNPKKSVPLPLCRKLYFLLKYYLIRSYSNKTLTRNLFINKNYELTYNIDILSIDILLKKRLKI